MRKLGREAPSVSELLTESGVQEGCSLRIDTISEHVFAWMHEAARRLSTRVPGKAYLWHETVKTV